MNEIELESRNYNGGGLKFGGDRADIPKLISQSMEYPQFEGGPAYAGSGNQSP